MKIPAALENAPILIPVPFTAKVLGISRASAYRHAGSGELPSKKLGGRIYVIKEKLIEMLESK